MLTIAEEILILLLCDGDGVLFTPVPCENLSRALAGAVLMDLSFARCIDPDPERVAVIDPTPTGNAILDTTLARLADCGPRASARPWIGALSVRDVAVIRESALLSLVARGVLRLREGSFQWAYRLPGHPWTGGEAEREVKRRVRDILFSDSIPGPRDVALIGLADACGLIGYMFPDGDVERCRPRLDRRRGTEPIVRELAERIAGIVHHVANVRPGATRTAPCPVRPAAGPVR